MYHCINLRSEIELRIPSLQAVSQLLLLRLENMLTAVSGTIPIEASPQLQTVLSLLDAFCNKEFEKVSSLLAEDYLHNLLPKSLGAPTRDKIGWVSHIQELLKIHNNFKVLSPSNIDHFHQKY